MAKNTKVTLAWPLERDGVKHKVGTTISVPDDEAASLLRAGRARTPDAKSEPEPQDEAPDVAPDVATDVPDDAPAKSTPKAAASAPVTAAAKGK